MTMQRLRIQVLPIHITVTKLAPALQRHGLDYAPGVEDDDSNEEEHWFYLKSNGKIQTGKASNINGQTYFFDEEGKMLTGWVAESDNDAYYSIQASDEQRRLFC